MVGAWGKENATRIAVKRGVGLGRIWNLVTLMYGKEGAASPVALLGDWQRNGVDDEIHNEMTARMG